MACSLRNLIPDDYIPERVNRVVELSWLRDEVRDLYDESLGRASIDPEAAVRLMPAGFFYGKGKGVRLLFAFKESPIDKRSGEKVA